MVPSGPRSRGIASAIVIGATGAPSIAITSSPTEIPASASLTPVGREESTHGGAREVGDRPDEPRRDEDADCDPDDQAAGGTVGVAGDGEGDRDTLAALESADGLAGGVGSARSGAFGSGCGAAVVAISWMPLVSLIAAAGLKLAGAFGWWGARIRSFARG